MPQIANQDYNVIDYTQLPIYEARERLYRAYQQGTAFDCVVIKPAEYGKVKFKVLDIEEISVDEANVKTVAFRYNGGQDEYSEKAPLSDEDGVLMIESIYIVSADGFKLKPVVTDGVLTSVEETTEKVENNVQAQYFKDWMIGQPVGA